MHKYTIKTAFLFSLFTFGMLSVSVIVNVVLSVIALHFGWLDGNQHLIPFYAFIATSLTSLTIGTIFSLIAARGPIRNIIDISEATKQIAKGDFSVRLNENVAMSELQTMAKNFNLMAKELASIEILRNDFIENVSHEIKSPLSKIEGYLTYLQRKNLSEEKREEYVQTILKSAKRLSSLTDHVLLLSRVEHHESEIKKETFSLSEQIREVILLFEREWTEKELILEIDLEPVTIEGNRELLFHVWQNLFGNAVKFTPRGGVISVSLQNGIIAKFSDNGIGMSEETLSRIFEKFYQGDASRSTEGNGLGLTLAKRIVDLHGGTISIESKQGVGSSFTVTLPHPIPFER